MTPEERKAKKAQHQRAWYERHRARHVGNVSARNAALREVNRSRLLDYLRAHPCVDGGEGDPVVLEFDHVQGDKVLEVTRLLWRSYSWEKIETEIGKCEVRCANGHRQKTARQFGHYRLALSP